LAFRSIVAESTPERISPLLRLLADALDARSSGDRPHAGAILCDLGRLARLQIPIRGALPLSDDQLFNEIDSVAVKHLDLAAVRETLDVALGRVAPLATRDEIEVAVDHLCAVLNVAYFNAGLAFGVTLADLKSL
jgi:hypothetical protein